MKISIPMHRLAHLNPRHLPTANYRLELGYVYLPDGRLFPVDESGFNLWNFGENGRPPTDYSFSFKAGNQQLIGNKHIRMRDKERETV